MKLLKITLSVIILTSAGFIAKAQDNELPFTINADTFSYSEDGSQLIAEGTVYVFSEDVSLKADKLIFDKQKDRIYAKGNVLVLDKELNSSFSESLELTGDLKQGVSKNMILMFKNSSGVMTSTKGRKLSDTKSKFENVEYTSCLIENDKPRAWNIKAKTVSHNAEKEEVIYRNAVFSLYDIPVMYMPVFYHSTNKDKAKSGFLTPGLSTSSVDGLGVRLGYYWAINDNQDATFKMTILNKRGTIYDVGHRYNGKKVSSSFRVEGLSDKTEDEHMRGMLSASAEYVIDEGKRFGFNSTLTSDEDYLDEIKDISDSYRYSTIYAENASQDSYLGVSGRYFIDMRNDVSSDSLAQPVGHLQYEKLFNTDENGGQIQLNTDVLALIREQGQDTNRVIGEVDYIKPFYSKDGSLFEFTMGARGDYYSYNEGNDDSSTENESRFVPSASLSWEKPFASRDFKHIITPKMMFITSPDKDFDDIPNEDSTSYELDATNLFEKNRFSGFDRVETGNRVVYGVDSKYGDAGLLKFHGFIGQSYNFSNKEENITDDTRSNNKNSDWVGFLTLKPTQNLETGTNFRLDSSNLSGQRVDSYIKIKRNSKYYSLDTPEEDYIRLTHSYLKDDSEEINLIALYNLNETLALKGLIKRNMYENITLTQEVDLVYKSCCYDLSFKLRKTNSDDEDKQNSVDFLVNFVVLPMGRNY